MPPVVALPRAAEPLLGRFCMAVTRRTFHRFLVLFVGSVLALGRHTVTGAPWAVRPLVAGSGHFSDYHRVLSRARRSLRPLGRVLAPCDCFPAGGDRLEVLALRAEMR